MATSTQLASGNWRVQVRRKTRYVAETFRPRKDGEEWALEVAGKFMPQHDRGTLRTCERAAKARETLAPAD